MSLVRPEIGYQPDEQMLFREAQLDAKVAVRGAWTKVLDIQSDGKGSDAIGGQPVAFYQLTLGSVSSGHHHHIEQMAIEEPGHQIAIQRSGDMPDPKELRPRLNQP
jgi:hypothetical protein